MFSLREENSQWGKNINCILNKGLISRLYRDTSTETGPKPNKQFA